MRRVAAIAALVTAPLLAGCGSAASSGPAPSATLTPVLPVVTGGVSCAWTSTDDALKPVALPPSSVDRKDHVATLVTSVGTLRINLTGSSTPCTSASFISLALQHFYDNTTCHRMGNEPGLMEFVQCGRPGMLPSGMEAGPGYSVPDELDGTEKYTAGTVAMARTQLPNSGGSQFFMVFGDSNWDPDYAILGHLDAASVRLLHQVGAKGNDGSLGGGTGAPNQPVTIQSVSIS